MTTETNALDVRTLLTPREREVMEWAAHGLTNAEIAAEMAVSSHAVKFHLASIYRKLRAANRTEATALYLGGILSRS